MRGEAVSSGKLTNCETGEALAGFTVEVTPQPPTGGTRIVVTDANGDYSVAQCSNPTTLHALPPNDDWEENALSTRTSDAYRRQTLTASIVVSDDLVYTESSPHPITRGEYQCSIDLRIAPFGDIESDALRGYGGWVGDARHNLTTVHHSNGAGANVTGVFTDCAVSWNHPVATDTIGPTTGNASHPCYLESVSMRVTGIANTEGNATLVGTITVIFSNIVLDGEVVLSGQTFAFPVNLQRFASMTFDTGTVTWTDDPPDDIVDLQLCPAIANLDTALDQHHRVIKAKDFPSGQVRYARENVGATAPAAWVDTGLTGRGVGVTVDDSNRAVVHVLSTDARFNVPSG